MTAFGLLGWLLYDALGLESAQVAVAVAGLAGVVVIIASSVPHVERDPQVRPGRAHGHRRFGPGVTDAAVQMIDPAGGWRAVVAVRPRI